MRAWNGWYHVNGNTYGTWLRGDRRGWRARHHREHCEGDYKNPPPPGAHEHLLKLSQSLLKHEPILLDNESREVAGKALVEMLLEQQIQVIALALDGRHYHILAKFGEADVRRVVGRAKKHAYFRLADRGFRGNLWAKRSRVLPVRDRRHQLNTFDYITGHAGRGAWIWTFRDQVNAKV